MCVCTVVYVRLKHALLMPAVSLASMPNGRSLSWGLFGPMHFGNPAMTTKQLLRVTASMNQLSFRGLRRHV